MIHLKVRYLVCLVLIVALSCTSKKVDSISINFDQLMIRVAEIEIKKDKLQDYLSILMEESEASVRLEPGVISIFPMVLTENPTSIRILEIYASKVAYESHLQTSHFKKYKSETEDMVKSLKLVGMDAVDQEAMASIFCKLGK